MKTFSVIGITKSGKTTTIEKVVAELRKRRYSVGSIKDIHFEKFAIDTEGSNTNRHKKAGAQLVTARGLYETDILFNRRLTVDEILRFYDYDYVAMEGVTDTVSPKIVAAHNVEEIDERLDGTVFAISGKIANELTEYKGIPVISALTDVDKLVDLIEEKVFERLPEFPWECCAACGYSCEELSERILKGQSLREDCVIAKGNIQLKIDGKEIPMVPFVQQILSNAIEGVVKELDGYRKNGVIEITLSK